MREWWRHLWHVPHYWTHDHGGWEDLTCSCECEEEAE